MFRITSDVLPDGTPVPVSLLMRTSGVLSQLLPESDKWGIDLLADLVAGESEHGWPIDPIGRLMAMVPPDRERVDGLAARLKLPNAARERLAKRMQGFYQIPYENFEKYCPYGKPEELAEFLGPYLEAGMDHVNLLAVQPNQEAVVEAAVSVKEALQKVVNA